MAVSAHGLAINPSLGDGVPGLGFAETQHLGHDGSRGKLHEHDMVQADLVERILESHDTLDLVCLDHGLQNVLDLQHIAVAQLATSAVGARDPVRNGENGAQVIRRVAPLSSKPAVIEIQPPDHGTDVEGTAHRIELIGGSGHAGAIGDVGALDDGAEQLGALGELEGLQTAAESVDEDPSRGVELQIVGVRKWQADAMAMLTARSELILLLCT